MGYELTGFTSAVACFIGELFVFGLIVSLFVLGHYHHAWRVLNTKQHPAPGNTNTLKS